MIKSLGILLQEVVEKEEKWFSLYEFLENATDEERKEINRKLTDEDYKQFKEFMDGFTFVSEDEVRMAVCEYYEKSFCRSASMGEILDLENLVENYIRENNLTFDDEEGKEDLPF